MSKKENTYFRNLVFNIWHRKWPQLYMTDADQICYTYVSGNVDVVAIIDLKYNMANWYVIRNSNMVIEQSSLLALYSLANKANIPFYVLEHDSAYHKWKIFEVLQPDNIMVVQDNIFLKDVVVWLYELRGLDYNTVLSADLLDELNSSIRIGYEERNQYIELGVLEAIKNLSFGIYDTFLDKIKWILDSKNPDK